jgi:hypothetical protein
VVERGARLREVIRAPDEDDLLVDGIPLWQRRPVRVRVVYRPLSADDVSALDATVTAHNELEGVLVEAASQGRGSLATTPLVQIVRAGQLIDWLNASALVSWTDGIPAVDRPIFDFARNRLSMRKADSIGLLWLPWLARNKRPPELAVGAGIPDALFEEMTFRLITSSLRFGGRRLGSSAPGSELPDAVVYPPSASNAVLVDCKAARDGYRMTAAHYRALREYVTALRPHEKRFGKRLTHVLVASSSFSGVPGSRHPYYARAKRLQSDAKARLVYVRADDLVRFALHLEQKEATPAQREAFNWSSVLDRGLVGLPDLLALDP